MLGTTWNQDLSLTLSYAHEFYKKASLHLQQSNLGNAGKGNLTGHIRSHVDFIGLQINYKI
jgi:long-subunit fatty acid transport protein